MNKVVTHWLSGDSTYQGSSFVNSKPSSGDWIKVFSALDEVQVQMITARLADAGIPTLVDRESVGTALPLQFGLMARIDIKVQVEKEPAAVEVLTDLGYLEIEDPDDEVRP